VIAAVARVLPCRIVGDPLQAIYRKLHADDIVPWRQVQALFPVADALHHPHRWQKTNPALGAWLMDVRTRLERGIPVDFGNAFGTLKWIRWVNPETQKGACYKAFDQDGVVAICDWPPRCVAIAEDTRNHFTVLESVECQDLMIAAEKIEGSTGVSRVAQVVEFARNCMTGMTPVAAMSDRLSHGKPYRPTSPDKARLWAAMQHVSASPDVNLVLPLLLAVESITDKHFYRRREPWQAMKQALRMYEGGAGKSLRDTAWAVRDQARKRGRRIVAKRTVATPLLIKGLEFNHALLLDAAQMKTAEELYVALTRGSSTLTVFSTERTVRHEVPAYLAGGGAETSSQVPTSRPATGSDCK
jgi:DNA helicase-2/ATP-dependent DNA helicase PcrA